MSKFIDISDISWHNNGSKDFALRAEIETLPPHILPLQKLCAEWVIKDRAENCYLVECSNCGITYILGNNIPFDEWKNSDNRTFCGRCGRQMRELAPEEPAQSMAYNADLGCFTSCSIT